MSDELDQAAQTATEHVAASAAEPGGSTRARPSRPAALEPDAPDGVCANCGTTLQGPVCHRCGQVADEFHRPVHGLVGEIVEGLLALDGRVARTIPNLLLRPGRITRAYLQGARARFMPPFRLYIIASLAFFLLVPAFDQIVNGSGQAENIAALSTDGAAGLAAASEEIDQALDSGDLTPEEAAQAREVLGMLGLSADPDPSAPDASADDEASAAPELAPGEASDSSVLADPSTWELGLGEGEVIALGGGQGGGDRIRRYFAPEDFGEPAPEDAWPLPVRRYLGERFAQVADDPDGWLGAVSDWIPRIMFVMVPVYAGLLALVYAWRRGFFFYDHLIVSIHFHAALFLAMALFIKLGGLIGAGWATLFILGYANAYLYRLHRVVYGRSRFSSVVRTLTLDVLYGIVLTFGFIAVLLLGAIAG